MSKLKRYNCPDTTNWVGLRILMDEHENGSYVLYDDAMHEMEICRATLIAHEQDTRDAATELLVPVPEPGTDMAKLLKSAVLSRRRATLEEEKNLSLLREIDGYKEVIKRGLLSMDCTWEQDNAGHDWADWCILARTSLEEDR